MQSRRSASTPAAGHRQSRRGTLTNNKREHTPGSKTATTINRIPAAAPAAQARKHKNTRNENNGNSRSTTLAAPPAHELAAATHLGNVDRELELRTRRQSGAFVVRNQLLDGREAQWHSEERVLRTRASTVRSAWLQHHPPRDWETMTTAPA